MPFDKCPHCGGNIIVSKTSYWWELTCLQASHTIADYKPGNTGWRHFPSPQERFRGSLDGAATVEVSRPDDDDLAYWHWLLAESEGRNAVSDVDVDLVFAPVQLHSLEEVRLEELVSVEADEG